MKLTFYSLIKFTTHNIAINKLTFFMIISILRFIIVIEINN